MKKQVFNPYLPSYEYVPDGEPYIFDNRLYIFGSHDKFGGTAYCENDYVCWSAPLEDISDWKYEGIIYKFSQHPYETEKKLLYAPDVTKGIDGKYYLYYSVADSSVISVAVCDTPAGKYEYYGDVKYKNNKILGKEKGEFFQFDPAIFIDDDNKIYLYSGFCPTLSTEDPYGRLYIGAHFCELEADMLTVKEKPAVLIPRKGNCPDDANYFEAPSLRKINGLYYFIYSAKCTGLHYYISKYPNKDFVYGGRLHSSSDVGLNGYTVKNPAYPVGNTHGSIALINGTYYIFDHRFSNNTSFSRQGVAEPLKIDENGHIKQAEATSCGLNNAPLKGNGTYPSYIACNLFHRDKSLTKKDLAEINAYITQDGDDRNCGPDQYIKGIKDGFIIGYKYFKFDNTSEITVSIRGTAKGTLKLSKKEESDYISELNIDINTSDIIKISGNFNLKNEVSALFFEYSGVGEFDLFDFTFK